MWAPALCTPGMASSSRLILVVERSISALEVPGGETQWMRKSRSLKPGNSDWPSCGYTAMPTIVMTANVAYAATGRTMIRESPAVYTFCSQATSGDLRRSIRAPRSSRRASAGVTVSATTIEAAIASV